MKKRTVFFPMLLAGGLLPCFAQYDSSRSKKMTLQECVDIAVKNNLLIMQSETQMQTNAVFYKQAKDNLLPTLNASADQSINFGRSINNNTNEYVTEKNNSGQYNLGSGLLLFSGLSYQNAIKQNAYAYDASKMDLQQQKDYISLAVILAYLQVLSSQDQLVISKGQAAVDKEQVDRLTIQNREGAVPPSTLYDLKGQYASDKINIANSINAVEIYKIALFQLLNIPYNREAQYERINFEIALPPNPSDSIFNMALKTIPLIKASDLRVKSYEKEVRYAKGKLYPTLSIYGTIGSNYSSVATQSIPGATSDVLTGDYINLAGSSYYVFSPQQQSNIQKISFGDQFRNNRGASVGLQLTIPIFNYFSARNNIKIARINLQNAKTVANANRNMLQQNVEQAYQNMLLADDQFKNYQEQAAAYETSFHAAEARFNEGASTSVDYIIAKNNVDRAHTNLAASKYNYLFRSRILDYYQGKLSW